MQNKSYTANYIEADSNFSVYNLSDKIVNDRFYPILCLLMNLLQRGNPTDFSDYLNTQFEINKNNHHLHLLNGSVPEYGSQIKGLEEEGIFPARVFFYELVPEYLGNDYPYIQQILIPEVSISSIVGRQVGEFKNQCVDFYLAEANLVIEIDGSQHKEKEQALLDEKRDKFLFENGIETIRIPSIDFKYKNRIDGYFKQIIDKLNESSELFDEYQRSYILCKSNNISEQLKAIATIRFQIAILQMCLSGMLSLDDDKWTICIKNHEVSGYEHAAIEDIFLWIENLCVMANIDFNRPFVSIEQRNLLEEVRPIYTRIEMSLFDRGCIFNTSKKWVCVYTDSRQNIDNFVMHTSEAIKYEIYNDENDTGENYNRKRLALRFVLKNLYGFDEFRPGQERIVINALNRRDTIGVLPTGSGKSLCYQLSVMMQPCISFCICPIKSLMIDQDMNLKARGITRTAFISSDLTTEERTRVQADFADGRYWFVFVSPERFQIKNFRKYLLDMTEIGKLHFGYAVIDEVHCLSEWGHDFRVSYLNLTRTIRNYCKEAVMLGLTATASYNVLKNILVEFKMEDKQNVISIPSFTREELSFKVVKVEPGKSKVDSKKLSKYDYLGSLLNNYKKHFPDIFEGNGTDSRCGIIFTPHVNGKRGCYTLAADLRHDFKARVEFYSGEEPNHVGNGGKAPLYDWLESELPFDRYKKKVQEDFKDNQYTLLTATKAFGMGIDKPNIRYTVHYGIPSSLEALYQEAGRAGRDRQRAQCTILYTPESQEVQSKIDDLLSVDSSIDQIHDFINQMGWDGEDSVTQLRLMDNGMVSFDEEKESIKELIEQYAFPGKRDTLIKYGYNTGYTLQGVQRDIYHLSLIGVVYDWTVDFKGKTISVDFRDYTRESIIESTQNYIRNYESTYDITTDPIYIEETAKEEAEEASIITALTVFWNWYYNNITYSRKQALYNVYEACNAYTDATADEFKEKMEAYFRLDDITDMFGIIADEPEEITKWFDVINTDTIKRKKASDILMALNRFLESYQHNVGLNYISGFLNLLQGNFESPNGRDRLLQALKVINGFKLEEKIYVLEETAKVMYELGADETLELFAEFYSENFPYEDTERIIYKITNDNYSLNICLKKMLSTIISKVGETKYGKH